MLWEVCAQALVPSSHLQKVSEAAGLRGVVESALCPSVNCGESKFGSWWEEEIFRCDDETTRRRRSRFIQNILRETLTLARLLLER